MSKTDQIEVSKLNLDLNNFRTTPQKSEQEAIKAMIIIKPERFFAVMDSIIDDGYLHTENIIVLEQNQKYIVKEGNRRIGALKLIHGYFELEDFPIPDSHIKKIKSISETWKSENSKVPCAIYENSDALKVDKIISLTHGKGEKASRYPWTSVATARHNRDINKASEPALDLLEKYIQHGQNISNQQKDRWAGDYPLTVLQEAINKIFNRFEVKNTTDLAANYPKVKHRTELEDIMKDIGQEVVTFPKIRAKEDFAIMYGINPLPPPQAPSKPVNTQNTTSSTPLQTILSSNNSTNEGSQNKNTLVAPSGTQSPSVPAAITFSSNSHPQAPKSLAINDPKHVANLLRNFTPRGNGRQKIVTLRDELKQIVIAKNPIAFCLLLRSIFEISAKVYANENSISVLKKDGKEKILSDLLKDITHSLTNGNLAKEKVLHGAITELSQSDRILSIKSMNQLVHNLTFSISPPDICTLFSNIYPLLEEMN